MEATGHRGVEAFQYNSRGVFGVDLPNLLKTWVTFLHTSSTWHYHKRSSQTNEIKLKTKIEAPLYNTIITVATITFSGSLTRSKKTCPSLFRVMRNLIGNFRLLMFYLGGKWTVNSTLRCKRWVLCLKLRTPYKEKKLKHNVMKWNVTVIREPIKVKLSARSTRTN